MPLPSSVKIKKDGVEYLNNVDACKYTITELSRAALRDVGKYVCRQTKNKVKKRTGRLLKNIQYWVRTKQPFPNLQVGFKPGGFYGGFQELGTSRIPKQAALTSSVEQNIDEIQKIEGQYLSAIQDENRAKGLIDEGEYVGTE